tara:strand:- start:372 stop:938 length:567 start_codon:yes stop_codon:yes gene_type:complete
MSTATATATKSFVQRAEAKKNKAVSQEAKQAEKGKVTETKKTETKSTGKKNKVKEGIEYTKVMETTPLEKFKSISDATKTVVTGRRPGFKAWGQLGIKIGQEIFYKHHPEIKAVVESEVTNQVKVTIPEEDDFVTFGVIPAEKHVRAYLESTKSNPQGFDMWGFHLEEDGSVKWRSVQDLYCAVFPKV